MIETRLLQQFIAVAEELHFNRAAERMHMAQPPLSQAIRRLESALGTPLFVRTHRNVALTPAGLLEALRRFRALNPGIAFTMLEATTQEQVNALEQGRADIGFMRTPGTTTPHLRMERLLSEPICVALPAGHRLAAEPGIHLASLKEEAFVASPRSLGKGFHDQLISLCQAAGFVPDIVQQGRQMQTLIALVSAGFGIALLPASLAMEAREDVVFRPLQVDAPEEASRLDLLMAWNETRPSAIRDRLLQAVLQTRSPS